MEIITSITFDKERHTIVEFLKNDVKPFVIRLIDPKRVGRDHVNGKSIVQTIESLISCNWTTMLTVKGQITGQLVPIELTDDAWMHVHLMAVGSGDRMVMLLCGQQSDLLTIDIGYIGDESRFNMYMDKINISQLEVHSNIIHYEQD